MNKTDTSKLIKVDLGPYASRLYKYDLYNDEEYRLDTSKGLKFLHFNNEQVNKHMPKAVFRRYQNRTAAVLALSDNGVRKVAADFLALKADQELFIPMTVGVTFLSKDDNYSKKIGRDEAVKKMADIDLKVAGLVINETHIYVYLAPVQGVQLTLRTNKKTGFSTVTGKLTGEER